jgi:hypothetical protein
VKTVSILALFCAFSASVTASAQSWEPCEYHNAPEGCEQRLIGENFQFGDQTLKVYPGVAYEYRLNGETFQRGHLRLELTADFNFLTSYGQKIVYPASSRVTIKDLGSADASLVGPIKADTTLKLEKAGRVFELVILRDNYTTGSPQQVEVYANGNLRTAYLGTTYTENIPLPVGQQVVIFRSSVVFHSNGAVRSGRVYSDFYFIETEVEPLFPDFYSTVFGEEYVIRGASRDRGLLLNFTTDGGLAPTDPNFAMHAPRRSADRVGDIVEVPPLPRRTCSAESLGADQINVSKVVFDHGTITVTTTSGRVRRRTQEQSFQVDRDLTVYDRMLKTYNLFARIGELPFDETPINQTVDLDWDETSQQGTLNLGSELAIYRLTDCH